MSEPVVLESGSEVIIYGRLYRFRLDSPNCGGFRHYHDELHADGSPGQPAHHHHEVRCADQPRQATLYPLWEPAIRHVHRYADGVCECGATRTPVGWTGSPDRKAIVTYQMPADGAHPDGWSYERNEEVDRESQP
jgi:hypothetical protein